MFLTLQEFIFRPTLFSYSGRSKARIFFGSNLYHSVWDFLNLAAMILINHLKHIRHSKIVTSFAGALSFIFLLGGQTLMYKFFWHRVFVH